MDFEKSFLGGLAALLVVLSLLMVTPFLGYILAAIILAFVLKPLQRKLEPYTGPALSTALVILFLISAVIAPFALSIGAAVQDARTLVDDIGEVETVQIDELESFVMEWTGQDIDIQQEISEGLESFTSIAFGGVTQLLDFITGLAVGMLILLFTLFYMIKDGDKLHQWLINVTPVEKETQNELYSNASLMTRSILKGHVLVAIVEGLLGGIALYIAGIPNAAFWTFVMILLSFIPVIGAFLVWAPAGLYMIAVGNITEGLFILIYGIAVVSPSDSILRPYLVDRRAEIHPAAVLMGVIGGVYVFGAVGLFIGPVIFGFCKTVLEVLTEEYKV